MTESASTVKFNVGGIIYEVRKSLIDEFPSTVLARSVSEEWKKEGTMEDPIFIERDPTRFRFCLDYMRDKRVSLPLTESKDAFIADLEYLGFDEFDSNSLTMQLPSVADALKTLMVSDDMYAEEVQTMRESLYHRELAAAFFNEFRNSGSYRAKSLLISKNGYPKLFPYFGSPQNSGSSPTFPLLNIFLERYGLIANGICQSCDAFVKANVGPLKPSSSSKKE